MQEGGIFITMLRAGLHIDIKNLNKYISSMVVIGFSTIFSGIFGMLILKPILLLNNIQSFIISTGMCLSSTIACQKIIEDNDLLHTKHGQTALVGTVIQDLIGIFLIILTKSSDLYNVHSYIKTIISILIAAIFLKISKNFFEMISHKINQKNKEDKVAVLIFLLSGCFLLSYKLDLYGMPNEITFLLFGILFNAFFIKQEYLLSLTQELLICFLFISCGTNINLLDFIYSIKDIVEILFMFSVIKILFNYAALSIFLTNREEIMKTAILLMPFSEISVFLCVFMKITDKNASIIIFTTTISMVTTKYIYSLVERILYNSRKNTIGIANYAARTRIVEMNDYIVFVGLNDYSLEAATELGYLFKKSIIIDNNLEKIIKSEISDCFFMDARFVDTYKIIDLKKANSFVININNKNIVTSIIKIIREINKTIKLYILCSKREDLKHYIILNYDNIYPLIIQGKTNEDVATMIVEEIQQDDDQKPSN